MGTIRADTIVASDGTSPVTLTKQSAAKAWVTLNGTGTVAIADSFNFSSVQDDGTGKYGGTVTSAMANANYYMCGVCSYNSTTNDFDRYIANNYSGGSIDARRTATQMKTGSYDTAHIDAIEVGWMTHGDLA